MAPEQIAAIRDLLLRWRAGEIGGLTLYDEAEYVWDEGYPWPNYRRDDSRSIPIEVLSSLESLTAQLIFREDVPALLAFLDTPPGEERTACDTLDRYWEAIDWDYRLHNHAQEYGRLAPGPPPPND
jgi:hypothetical protein